jgi:hypothetical protein
MDYDQYSAHDAIGRVYLSLASLINPLSGTIPLEGWFPIYDTLHGVRGEIQIKASIEVIKDHHKRSSNEILFFTGYSVPGCYSIIAEHGFIEELVVNIDPEYQVRVAASCGTVLQVVITSCSGLIRSDPQGLPMNRDNKFS